MAQESVFEILQKVRSKPGLFLGATSISRLEAFLAGYDSGLATFKVMLSGYEAFHDFHQWVADKLGFSNATSGWCSMILKHSKNEEDALGRFFELLDEFKSERGIK